MARSGRDPANYQFPRNPPYGYRVVDRKLVPDRREMKMAQRILQLKKDEGTSCRQIDERLNAGGYQTRTCRPWNQWSLREVYDRWREKL